MIDNRPRAAVGTFPYPHRTVAEIDYANGFDHRATCFRCGARGCFEHSAANRPTPSKAAASRAGVAL